MRISLKSAASETAARNSCAQICVSTVLSRLWPFLLDTACRQVSSILREGILSQFPELPPSDVSSKVLTYKDERSCARNSSIEEVDVYVTLDVSGFHPRLCSNAKQPLRDLGQ